MTGTVGIILAVVAGWLVADRRKVVMVVVLPYLAVLAVQTWGIAAGDAVSPPSTVNAFPDAIGYYGVQVLILALALGIALQISALRFRGAARTSEAETRRAYILNWVATAVVAGGYTLDRVLFEQNSVIHHTSNGSPPLLGLLGIGLLFVGCAGLGCVTLWRRFARPAVDARAGA
jgi:hypothetical protein